MAGTGDVTGEKKKRKGREKGSEITRGHEIKRR
jgi:hypothetical protein